MRIVFFASVFSLIAVPVFAQAPAPKTYVLSAPLVEEIFQRLSSEPYGNVAGLIAKLQTEVQRQVAPTAPMASPEPTSPPEPPKK